MQNVQAFDCTDVRVTLREVFEQAREAIRREKTQVIDGLLLIGRLDAMNAAVNLGIPYSDFPARLGLTRDQYEKRVRAARVVRRFPVFLTMLREGKTHLANLALAYSKVTEANLPLVLRELPGKSKREATLFFSTLNYDGTVSPRQKTLELRLEVTEEELKLLARAREVLSAGGRVPSETEVLVQGLKDLLRRRDPVQAAERAQQRTEKKASGAGPAALAPGRAEPESPVGRPRTKVPAAIVHAVMLRDQGQCTHVYADGTRCPARGMIELDHAVRMWCRGGEHSVDNIWSKCRSHNQASARAELGDRYMDRWRARSN